MRPRKTERRLSERRSPKGGGRMPSLGGYVPESEGCPAGSHTVRSYVEFFKGLCGQESAGQVLRTGGGIGENA